MFLSITLAKFPLLPSQSNPHNWVIWTSCFIKNEDDKTPSEAIRVASLGEVQLEIYSSCFIHKSLNQFVIGAATSFFGAVKYAFINKILYIAQGGGYGGLGHLGPFAGVEFVLKSIPKPVDDFNLPLIQRNRAMLLPKQ